jgi:hypothetical protein
MINLLTPNIFLFFKKMSSALRFLVLIRLVVLFRLLIYIYFYSIRVSGILQFINGLGSKSIKLLLRFLSLFIQVFFKFLLQWRQIRIDE